MRDGGGEEGGLVYHELPVEGVGEEDEEDEDRDEDDGRHVRRLRVPRLLHPPSPSRPLHIPLSSTMNLIQKTMAISKRNRSRPRQVEKNQETSIYLCN